MRKRTKALAVVLLFAVIGFLIQPHAPLGAMLWPPAEDIPTPVGLQAPLLLAYSVLASIGFGLGVAFLFLGRPLVRRLDVSNGLATATHLSIAWVLVNWVIHDSLHIATGHDLWGLIAIEFAFHGTLILAGGVIAYAMIVHGRGRTGTPDPNSLERSPGKG